MKTKTTKKKEIKVCEICESQCCDGKVYVAIINGRRHRICKNSEDEIIEMDGVLKLKWIIGHGHCVYYEVEEEKTDINAM